MNFGKSRNTTQFISELEAFYATEYYSGIYYDISRFKQFLIHFENQLSETNKSIMAELSKEELDIKLSMLRQPHVDNSINHFPDILRNSSFITIYSYLEAKLFELTVLSQQYLPLKLTFPNYLKQKSRKKPKIVMLLNYFEHELDLDFDSKKEIDRIEDFRFIRECIVHCNSDISISKDKIKIEQIIKRTTELDCNYGILSINSNDYLFKLTDFTIKLFDDLITKMSSKYK